MGIAENKVNTFSWIYKFVFTTANYKGPKYAKFKIRPVLKYPIGETEMFKPDVKGDYFDFSHIPEVFMKCTVVNQVKT